MLSLLHFKSSELGISDNLKVAIYCDSEFSKYSLIGLLHNVLWESKGCLEGQNIYGF